MVSTAKVHSDLENRQQNLTDQDNLGQDDEDPVEDNEHIVQGLSQIQIQVLAQKVYDMLLDELRIEGERYGRRGLR